MNMRSESFRSMYNFKNALIFEQFWLFNKFFIYLQDLRGKEMASSFYEFSE